ncbi:putative membrane protein [Microbacterium trichothecenolyticum]|uniref:heparan-alpha-glucosaminide N-acetyltransferase domain-containing protein n=1 Tax=Microbacterium trichothecenolyticum TaxID=69370 RepID=UPI0028626CD2|nr:heparan-alpha-glucosaminide N-acetyltransferase domain-containing protein [Microbacterium trichothecenolyticum]MDR7112558.1 putative membrane protein [Microbacterium trichothecenolyticum]
MSGRELSDTERPASRADGWLATRWERLNGPARIGGVDLARGLAVLGMFAAHLLWITEPFDVLEPDTWIAVVSGRSSILFATLAGVSIGLMTGGRMPLPPASMATARRRLAVRAGLLWVLGILLIATGVPVYVILPAYALMFLLALPLASLPARALLLLAGALAVIMPFVQVFLDALPFWGSPVGAPISLALGWHYPFTTWIAFVVAGLGVARAGVTRLRVQVWLMLAGTVLAAIGYGLGAATGSDPAAEAASYLGAVWTARPHSTGLLEVIGSGGFALAVLGLCLLACRTVLVWVVLPLRAVGAMPLTAYTLQLAVWGVIAASVLDRVGDLTGFRDLQPFWPLTIGTIVLCTAWALLVGRGPLETLLDAGSRFAVPAGRVPR